MNTWEAVGGWQGSVGGLFLTDLHMFWILNLFAFDLFLAYFLIEIF